MKHPNSQHANRDIFNVEQGDISIHNHEAPRQQRSPKEQQFLSDVKGEIEKFLADSLIDATNPLNLDKEAPPNQVEPVSDGGINRANVAITIQSDMAIAEIFNLPRVNGRLLILGKSGAGKTTTLLQLARALMEKAENDPSYPIPVPFNLSRWENYDSRQKKDKQQTIQEWMASDLKSRYGSPLEDWQKWLTDRYLLPLLDGLDEVAPERKEKCVQKLNEFLADTTYAVVCSRIEGYKTLLQLNMAVSLKQLSNQQIQEYLYLPGVVRKDLWQLFTQNSTLLEFVRTPLFLKIAVLTYRSNEAEQWQRLQMAENQVQYLLNDYVKPRLEPIKSRVYGAGKPPNRKQTCYWLAWLADQMKNNSQTEFLIEEMQPSMLPDDKKKKHQQISKRISTLVLVLMIVPTTSLITVLAPKGDYGLFENLLPGLIIGTCIAIASVQMVDFTSKIKPVEVLKWSQKGFREKGLLGGVTGKSEDWKPRSNQGIERSVINFLTVVGIGGMVGVVIGVVLGLLRSGSPDISTGLILGLGMGIAVGFNSGGGFAAVQHFVLRWLLYRSKFIPWNYAQFLNYCTERELLQRVGGRYSFIHNLLRDHFASKTVNPSK